LIYYLLFYREKYSRTSLHRRLSGYHEKEHRQTTAIYLNNLETHCPAMHEIPIPGAAEGHAAPKSSSTYSHVKAMENVP
jgi:hypothetical protein